ncbi:MAG: SH3 domain-containing protein [Lachnospiraceae bacterium]|nr:SH3 domain-containing protein [Lachnospiraceae bacterium]
MRKTAGKQMKKVFYAVMCGTLLLLNKTNASAATEAVYEYNVERGESNVYRGVVNVDGLNVRTAAGKDNPIVQLNGQDMVLDKNDEVAILDQAISNDVWYKVSFRKGEAVVVGYVHSSYVNLTVDVITPLPTPTPLPTATPLPTPTPLPTATPLPTITPAGTGEGEGSNGGGGLIAFLVVALIGIAILVMLWYLKKRNDDAKGNETNEKIDNLKNMPLSNAPLSADGTPIPVMKRRETIPQEETGEQTRRVPVEKQDEVSVLADRERARLMNEEMIRQYRNGENEEEEERLRQVAANLKEKEVLREEIDRLRIGDMVYHEYFGKGIVRDNSDVKVIEISFGQDVRFLNKASCAAKRLLRKL